MSLPSLQELKDRLRIENDAEDDDLEVMRDSALAVIEERVGRPLEVDERTWVLESPHSNWDGVTPVYRFFLPLYRCSTRRTIS
jgi:hypothetical protein